MIFALVGNQNCGKTTLFNQLTGSNQHVGNFPGVTVARKSGTARAHPDCTIVDLPGIYAFRPYSTEEIVTRDFLLDDKPDGILNIIDATNLERSLYLTLQLLELDTPMVLALNMMDEVRGNGGSIDVGALSQALGVPAVPVSAVKNEGVQELMDTAVQTVRQRRLPAVTDFCAFGPVYRCIHAARHEIGDSACKSGLPVRFVATKLIENDPILRGKLQASESELEAVERAVRQMETACGLDRNAALADMRYTFIEGLCAKTAVQGSESREHRRSERIDRVLTGKYTAIPVFLLVMAAVFFLTFRVIGKTLSDWLALGVAWLTGVVDFDLTVCGVHPVVHSLIVDGVFTGVGAVLSFLPVIVTLFFFLSILEDTGYMARVAFVMDQLLRRVGLSGRSIVPMLIGFGCSVPAVMATRTLASERDRKMTLLLTPFMSCSAKIPIYAVFSAAFFPDQASLVMTGLYAAGVGAGVLAAIVLDKTAFRGSPVPFVMELPNYRFPSPKSVLLLLWDKAKDFLERAFTVIFMATILIWFLQTFDAHLTVVADRTDSLLARIGAWLVPVFAPLGFGDWRAVTALLSGFIAKESVVSTLGVLLGSASDVGGALGTLFTPVTAVSFLVFTLLYTPCVAAISAIRRELGSGWKAAGVALLQCCVAWLAAFAAYHAMLLLA